MNEYEWLMQYTYTILNTDWWTADWIKIIFITLHDFTPVDDWWNTT